MRQAMIVMMLLFAAGVLVLANCSARFTPSPAAVAPVSQQSLISVNPSATPSARSSLTQDPELAARATMLFLLATDTAIAAEKTEVAYLNAQQTAIQETYDQANSFTGTAIVTQTSGAGTSTAYAAQVIGTQTAVATITQGASTRASNETSTAAAATKVIEQDKLNATRFGIWSMVILIVLVSFVAAVLGLLFLGSKVWGSWQEQKTRKLQNSRIEPDQHGRYPIVPASALGKDNEKIVNPNLSHRAVTDLNHDDLTTEQALQNTANQRDLETIREMVQTVSTRKLTAGAQPRQTLDPAALPNADMNISRPEQTLLPEMRLPIPMWSIFRSWDGKGGIPYGVSPRGLEQVSIQQVPHGGVFGKTGSGKSRGFLRPFIAGAIASGQRVVIIGKEVDFWPFAEHLNVKMIGVRNITDENEAARYADYLKRIVEEMNRRDGILTSRRVATWDRAGFENTLIILDELGNALDMMPSQIRQEAHRWVGGLVREGRKYGFNIWLATQRAVGFKSIVEQLGRAVFYLADADASRHALGFPGAEKLQDGQFFAKFQRTQICAAFDPTDDELISFLRERNVPVHEPIDWIEGSVMEEQSNKSANEQVGISIDDQILEIYKAMKQDDKVSLSEIQRRVYGDTNTGGAHFRHIQDVIAKYMEGATTTKNMPNSGTLSSSATA